MAGLCPTHGLGQATGLAVTASRRTGPARIDQSLKGALRFLREESTAVRIVPEELARREARLAKLAAARAKIKARAKERFERERAEHEARLAERAAKTAATGRKPGGRAPQPPLEGPQPKEQINLTDEDSRIMPVAGGGFEQCYNAQAAVAADSLLVVTHEVVQAPNDKQQLAPMVEKLNALPDELGPVDKPFLAAAWSGRHGPLDTHVATCSALIG